MKLNHSPAELSYVLKRILPLLKSMDQSTRTHTAMTIGEISKNIPQFDPKMSSTVTVPLPTEQFQRFKFFQPLNYLSVSERLVKNKVKRKLTNSSSRPDSKIEESAIKRRKISDDQSASQITIEYKKKEEQETELLVNESYWPFHQTTNLLFEQLMSPVWYHRHGAALALHEIIISP